MELKHEDGSNNITIIDFNDKLNTVCVANGRSINITKLLSHCTDR